MEENSKTQPVILVGVDEQEARSFNKVVLISQTKEGLHTSEKHLQGKVLIQMLNGTLVIKVSPSDS